MSFLKDLINPPPTQGGLPDHYKFFNSTATALGALTSVTNPSVVTNVSFQILGPHGLTPTTQANGNDYEFIKDWFVFGATAADYVITPTAYASNSTVKSSSLYYVHTAVTTANGNPFYFYQKQLNTVRQYQSDFFTYGLHIKNNQSKAIQLRMDIFTFYNPTSSLKKGSTFFLQPGMNAVTATIQTDSLKNIAVGAGSYTEFRLNFTNLVDGTANLDLYHIKCELGKISTPIQ